MLEQKVSKDKYREQISDFLYYTLLKKAYYHIINNFMAIVQCLSACA